MKDFEIGQKVFTINRGFLWSIREGCVFKKYPNSDRWRIERESEFTKSGKDSIMKDDNEVFLTFDEAFESAMKTFDKRLRSIEDSRDRFVSNSNKLKEKDALGENGGKA